jgi:Pectate lyase superfamily protein
MDRHAEITRRAALLGGVGIVGGAGLTWLAGTGWASESHRTKSFGRIAALESSDIVYPPGCAWDPANPDTPGVIDITQPPFNAVSGTDCTAAIIGAIDRAVKLMRDNANTNGDHVECPEESMWTIYFPNGTYYISDTLVYSPSDDPYPSIIPNHIDNFTGERLQFLRLRGESEDGVVLQLVPDTFTNPSDPKPVVSFTRTILGDSDDPLPYPKNNVVGSNFIENMTIDIGTGNAGAIGLIPAAANNNAIRNVTIRTSDVRGTYGLQVPVEVTQFLASNLTITGFETAIEANASQASQLTFNDLTLADYGSVGLHVTGSCVSVENLTTSGAGSAVVIDDTPAPWFWPSNMGVVSVINSDMTFTGSGDQPPAVDVQSGTLFIRSQDIHGFGGFALNEYKADGSGYFTVRNGGIAGERITHGNVRTIFSTSDATSLGLPNTAAPDIPWSTDPDDWANVKDTQYAGGAKGNGWNDPRTHLRSGADDSDAIQAALNSGKPNIYFPPAKYLIGKTLTIPATVQRINFMFSHISAGNALIADYCGDPNDLACTESPEQAVFSVSEYSDNPLIIEDTFSRNTGGRYRFISHDCTRKLVLSDLHTGNAPVYRNTVDGTQVWLENVSCRTDGTDKSGVAVDEGPPGFYFQRGTVWARHINPEHAMPEILNDGATLWILGFKTENLGTFLESMSSSKTEILNGVVFNAKGAIDPTLPLLEIDSDSSLSCTLGTSADIHRPMSDAWNVYVQQRHDADVHYLEASGTASDSVYLLGDDDVRGPNPDPDGTNNQRRLMLFVGRPAS